MNGIAEHRNGRRVLIGTRFAALAIAAAACAACGSQARAPVDGAPGTTTLLLANHVAAPFELERLVVRVDGRALSMTAVPPADASPALLARVELAPGDHELALMGTAITPGTATRIVVHTDQTIRVGTAPARVVVDVTSARGHDDALDVAMHVRGATVLGSAGGPHDERACAGTTPLKRAICRARTRLDDAQQRSDPAYLVCIQDKLSALEQVEDVLADRGDDGASAATPHAPRSSDDLAADAALAASERIAALNRELDRCAPRDVAAGGTSPH